MCLYSEIMRNGKYKPNKKNGGIIPAFSDTRVLGVAIRCGRCIECRKQKAREWQVRLLEDVKTNKNGIMVTLTFNDKSIKKLTREIKKESIKEIKGYELDNRIATKAVRYFTERWRKKHKKTIRHWLVTELGHNGTENIHLHGIVWTDESIEEITEKWKYGYVYPTKEQIKNNYVSERTVNYIVKYIHKQDQDHREYNSIILTSNGIGKNYINTEEAKLNKYKKGETKETYTTRTGHQIAMPVYWRNQIYTEEERELLWLEKLDKNERWVGGEKVEADDGETLHELTTWYRNKSIALGYQEGKKDLTRKKYEEDRREIMQEIRINRADAQDGLTSLRAGEERYAAYTEGMDKWRDNDYTE